MLPLLHTGWRRGRAVASGLRHPYQVRRLRSVFGSGRACRNSWDFRTAVISASPLASPRAQLCARCGAQLCARRGAAPVARDTRPVTRSTHHRPPRLYHSRQAPAITPVACSRRMPCRMLLSHHGHRGPRHRLTRLISRPAPKPHLSSTSSRTRTPQFARIRPPRSRPALTPSSPAPAPAPRPRSPPARAPPARPRPRSNPALVPARPSFPPGPRSPSGLVPRPPSFPPAPLPMDVMKPRIQCVLAQWIPGFTAAGPRSPSAPAPGLPLPVERHETPDPVRSGAVDPRFHCVRHPLRATHPTPPTPREPEPEPESERKPRANRAQPPIRGKPFLTASNPPADYAELPTARTSPERIEGVSRSLPYSDLLALTSSHMFFSVMN
jgi:hypothetical protein